MDLLKKTQELCRLYEIKPARSKGQNFLIKESIYDWIVETAELNVDDIVLEVGPGLGFLTSKLAKIVKKVIAVELDEKLAEVLKTGLLAQGVGNVEVINANILDISVKAQSPNYKTQTKHKTQITNDASLPVLNSKYKIVANLPYNISSVFLRKFLSSENKPESMVLMLQREVAERICARPGKMSLLSVSVQFYAEPVIIQTVSADSFWPQPEVDSCVVKLKVKSEKLKVNDKEFFRLVKIGFSARRKMLKNNLSAGYKVDQKTIAEKIKMTGISENCRPQELSVEDWIRLSALIS